MKRTKVLHLITHLGNGGALDNTLLTCAGLPRDKYEVDLGAGRLDDDHGYVDWSERAARCADSLLIFPELQRAISPVKEWRALNQLTSFIRQQGYQIVHTHCAKAGALGRIAARKAGAPIVIHSYHSFGWQVAHGFHDSAWQNRKAALLKKVYVGVERYASSLSDALVTVADLGKKEALELKIAPESKFTTIYSGIELEHFDRRAVDRDALCRRLGLEPGRPVIGMVGRLSTQKAPGDFIQAARLVLRRRPDAQFVIAGDGPLADEVRAQIESEPRIHMAGFVEDIQGLLAALDVFALSSLWEGLGRAVTEAMAMAVPVAVTEVGGVPELIEHRSNGLLSAPRQPDALAANILWLLGNRARAQALGDAGRKSVRSRFSAQMMVEQTERLYERLLEDAARRDIPKQPVRRSDLR